MLNYALRTSSFFTIIYKEGFLSDFKFEEIVCISLAEQKPFMLIVDCETNEELAELIYKFLEIVVNYFKIDLSYDNWNLVAQHYLSKYIGNNFFGMEIFNKPKLYKHFIFNSSQSTSIGRNYRTSFEKEIEEFYTNVQPLQLSGKLLEVFTLDYSPQKNSYEYDFYYNKYLYKDYLSSVEMEEVDGSAKENRIKYKVKSFFIK